MICIYIIHYFLNSLVFVFLYKKMAGFSLSQFHSDLSEPGLHFSASLVISFGHVSE